MFLAICDSGRILKRPSGCTHSAVALSATAAEEEKTSVCGERIDMLPVCGETSVLG